MRLASANPVSVYERIREGYLRYIETAFWLRDESIASERRALLESEGMLFTEALLEPLLPYPSKISLATALERSGTTPSIATTLARMLFGPTDDGSFLLRDHQARSLEVSLAPPSSRRRNVVVTSGTGSGKTECFLLPILARLLL